jgi:hypothetical protein
LPFGPSLLSLLQEGWENQALYYQFAGGIDVLEVLIDDSQIYSKEFRHLFLRQLESLALKEHLDAEVAIRRGIQNDLVVQRSLFVRGHLAPRYSFFTSNRLFQTKLTRKTTNISVAFAQ